MSLPVSKHLRDQVGPLAGIAAVGGFVNDVLRPLANFAVVFLVISVVGVVVCLVMLYWFKKDGKFDKKERMLSKAMFFGILSAIWAVVLPFYTPTSNGYLAENIESVADLQKSLLGLEEDVSDIKENTEQILENLDNVELQIAQVDESAGVISDPKTPQQYFNNAVVSLRKGENSNAQMYFEELFTFNLAYLDPHLMYLDLRAADSKEDLRAYYDDLLAKEPDNAVVEVVSISLLEDREARIAAYESLLADGKVKALALYRLAWEHSWNSDKSASQLGRQQELEYLEELQALPADEGLSRYFITVDERKPYLEFVENELSTLTSGTTGSMLDNPVSANLYPTGVEGEYTLFLLVKDQAAYIWYRVDGEGEFAETGENTAAAWAFPGQRMANNSVTVKLTPGEHSVEVKYQDNAGSTSEVYTVTVTAQ